MKLQNSYYKVTEERFGIIMGKLIFYIREKGIAIGRLLDFVLEVGKSFKWPLHGKEIDQPGGGSGARVQLKLVFDPDPAIGQGGDNPLFNGQWYTADILFGRNKIRDTDRADRHRFRGGILADL